MNMATALFVVAIAFISYGEIKRQFDAIAAKHLLERHRNTSGIAVRRRATALNAELVGIGPMYAGLPWLRQAMPFPSADAARPV
jgi:hypothetical protein